MPKQHNSKRTYSSISFSRSKLASLQNLRALHAAEDQVTHEWGVRYIQEYWPLNNPKRHRLLTHLGRLFAMAAAVGERDVEMVAALIGTPTDVMDHLRRAPNSLDRRWHGVVFPTVMDEIFVDDPNLFRVGATLEEFVGAVMAEADNWVRSDIEDEELLNAPNSLDPACDQNLLPSIMDDVVAVKPAYLGIIAATKKRVAGPFAVELSV